MKPFNLFNWFAKSPYVPLITRIISLLAFAIIITTLYFGTVSIASLNFSSNATMFLVWVLWWPFLYITLFFFARLWCGFLCPLSLANEAGNYMRKGKAINYRKWAFIPYILFFFIVYIEQTSGLFLSARITLMFFVLAILLAVFMGMILSRFAFCKLVCPIGAILSVFSRLSMIGLRTNKDKCFNCSTKNCILGGNTNPCPVYNDVPNLKSNKDCLLCTNCIENCPHGSAKITIINPGKEIKDKIGFTLEESFFIIALLGLAFVLTTNGTMLTRIVSAPLMLSGGLLRAADFIIGIGAFLLAFTLISYGGAKVSKTYFKTILTESGYYFLPLVFLIMFYTITVGFLGPSLPIEENILILFKYISMIIGAVWSASLILNNYAPPLKYYFLSFLLIITLFWGIVIIADPLNILNNKSDTLIVTPGDRIEMDAFSMGYSYSKIIVEKGKEVDIIIKNRDITHAFDIDEFDIHRILKGDETTRIKFTPDKTGEFTYYCGVPGHTEAGMQGIIEVVDSISNK